MNTHQDPHAVLLRHADWRKASASQGANACVEVAQIPGWFGIRDSKLGASSPMLALDDAAWRAFTTQTR